MSYGEYKYDPYVRAFNIIADGGEICHGGFDPKNDPNDRRKLIVGIVAAVVFIVLFVTFSSCNHKVYVPVERTTTVTQVVTDTVVEIRLEVVHDTITIESFGRDTASYMANDTHYSFATWHNGRLGHSLGTLPGASVKGPVQVVHTHTIDSIPYAVPVEVEKKLSWWERTKLEYGGFAMGVAAFLALVLGIMLFGSRIGRD